VGLERDEDGQKLNKVRSEGSCLRVTGYVAPGRTLVVAIECKATGIYLFWWDWGLNLGHGTCKADSKLELCLRSIFGDGVS
jgi:hypothetical protein